VRFCLAEPKLFLTQLRAILRASHYGSVRILIPMLASAGEIEQTLQMIELAKESLREQGVPFDSQIRIGGMIEIPAAVIAMDAFVAKLDFLSIGTNDLIQYTLAVDRADEAVAHLYDPLHPAVIRLLAMAITMADKAKCPIAVCGEMAGEVRLTRLLLGLGLVNFSMHPAHLLEVKQRVLTSEAGAAKALVDRIRRADHPDKIAALVEKLNAV
jgi:phosphotransferase system enzyme I (PtsI)